MNDDLAVLLPWPRQLVEAVRYNRPDDGGAIRGRKQAQTRWNRHQKYRPNSQIQVKINDEAKIIVGDDSVENAISSKLPITTKSQKCYHPIIRLQRDRVKLCIVQLICLLITIVPTNSVDSFHINHKALPQNNTSNYQQIYLQNHRFTGPYMPTPQMINSGHVPSLSMFNSNLGGGGHPNWAAPNQQANLMLAGQPQTLGGINMYPTAVQSVQPLQINQVVHRRNEIQQQQQLMNPYQAYQLQPVRPAKLMAEYVANQGQRILKNLVNTTIADLVNQSTMKITANKMNNMNQPTILGSPFPKMNKLYTLLFPTPSPPVLFVPTQTVKPQPINTNQTQDLEAASLENGATGNGGGETSVHTASSSSSTNANSDSNSDSDSDMYLNHQSQGREEKQQHHQQILSLSAPYESQPRPTLDNRGHQHQNSYSRQQGGFQQVGAADSGGLEATNGDEWRQPDNVDPASSSLGQEVQPMGLFEHQHSFESVADALNENSSFRGADMDTDSLSSYESAELIHPHHMGANMDQRDIGTDTRKPLIIRDTELYSSSQNMGETSENHSQLDNNNHHNHNLASAEPDYSRSQRSNGVARGHKHTSTEVEHQYEQDPSSNRSLSNQLVVSDLRSLRAIQAQESVDIGQGGSGDSSSFSESSELQIQMPRRSTQRQPKLFKHHKNKHHLHRTQHHMSGQSIAEDGIQSLNEQDNSELQDEQDLASNQQLVNETRGEIIPDRYDGMSVHGGYASEEPSASSEQPTSKGGTINFLNNSTSSVSSQQADDSYFTAHLPSQYDAVMRLPPEGYYDDYFKPNSAPNSQASSLQPASSSIARESDSSTPEFSSPTSGSRNLIEGVVQYETVMEGLRPATNFTSGGGPPSGRNKKHSIPSYHSQIITTEQQFDNSNNDNNNNNNSNSFSYSQPTVAYAKKYHANQQPLRSVNEARIEFMVPGNRTLVSEDKGGLEALNYEIPSIYERTSPTNNQQNINQPMQMSNVTLEPIPVVNEQRIPISNAHRYQTMTPRSNSTLISSQSINAPSMNPQNQTLNEDSIKLIIANTISDSRDPQSNEKLINYTSEGYNMTRGKSPRNNFINKDMNEFAPADPPTPMPQSELQDAAVVSMGGSSGLGGGPGSQRGLTLQHTTLGHQAPGVGGGSSKHGGHFQVLLPQFPRPSPPVGGQQRPTTPAQEQQKQQQRQQQQQEQIVTIEQSDPRDVTQNEEINSRGPFDDEQNRYRTSQRIIVESADGKRISPVMDLKNSHRQPRGPSVPLEPHHEQHHQDHHNDHVELQQQQPSPLKDPPEQLNEEPTQRADEVDLEQQPIRTRQQSADQKSSILRDERKRERRARQRGKFSRQQTMARPQVTQVSFNQKDLVMQAPKPLPSASESPLEALVEIPLKVEQLRDNQPDKNELMNELLTALDRVKVAIYKLQPLTAKMNAIYRKSVTSNTRDIIMDNHKGTYAKRYPPGDYDDTYDRMHPSELLSRHAQAAAASQRSDDASASGVKPLGQLSNSEMDANESVENAVYLPAPREMLEKHKRNSDNENGSQQVVVKDVGLDSLSALESKLIATGIGRRLGDGRVTGLLSLGSGERLIYDDDADDDGTEEMSSSNASSVDRSMASFFPPLNQSSLNDEEIQEPLFGYRITIYRSPEAEAEVGDTDTDGKPSEQLAYQVDGSDEDKSGDEEPAAESSDELDSISTSESSLVYSAQQPMASEELGPSVSIADPAGPATTAIDLMVESESKGKEEKSGHKSEEKKKSKKNELQKRKKNEEEESKKKKEYKKIKHKKGIVSKEKKTMKRDKHIKAHDRGAAKEKALKERTQIEFFEREQIVDDEFEKGKKSTLKGAWQTGQDSKKKIREISGGGGDTMSSGGSHYVEHEPKEMGAEKGGHMGVSSEASSAKKSNKFEKKEMEAKGKKFKGWREKGYKIITETEFVDRGSLHDSAYKKRDKGAANHQKFKKQEASSEGHHGSMLEHHKKSNKKEEKKFNEKKGEKMKEKKKKVKKSKPAKKEDDDHHRGESVIAAIAEPDDERRTNHGGGTRRELATKRDEYKRSRGQQQQQPMLMSATSSTFRPAILMHQNSDSGQTRTLIRLLNSNVHDEQQLHQQQQRPMKSGRIDGYHTIQSPTNRQENRVQKLDPGPLGRANANANSPTTNNEPNIARYQLLNATAGDSNRRSDMQPNPVRSSKHQRSSFSNSSFLDRGNSTILDIVDNLTGRQINKTKIGTYDLEDHHTIRLNNNSNNNNNNNNNSTPLVKISDGLAKYFPFLSSQAAPLSNRSPQNNVGPNMMQQSQDTLTSTISTTMKPTQSIGVQIKQPGKLLDGNNHGVNLHDVQYQSMKQRAEPMTGSQMRNTQLISTRPTDKSSQVINYNAQTTRMPGFITPEQANAAAHLLQIVHRASQVDQVSSNAPANHQPSNLMDLQAQLNPLQDSIHRAAFIPPAIANPYQSGAMLYPSQMNFAPPNTASFGLGQFADYEHDSILQRSPFTS